MTTVIVPLDGSAAAEAALLPARWIADTLGGSIVLLTVSAAVSHQRDQELLRRALVRMGSPGSARRVVLPGSFPGQSILQAAATYEDPVLCLSTRGQGALATAAIGGVATEVLAHGDVPTVLVGPSFDPHAHLRGVIVQCSTDPASLAPDELGPRCARKADLELHLLHVDHNGADGHALAAATTAAAARMDAAGIHATADDFSADDVPRAILGVVRSLHAQLLAIRRNQRSGRIERPLGRVGIELVRSCPCPVFVDVPAPSLPERDAEGAMALLHT